MRIRILGGGWYGSHISLHLLRQGHDVVLHEIAGQLFSGASGGNPARCHLGFHYPRSGLTQAACQEHAALFMQEYGFLTHGVPINIYAIAQNESLVDFASYQNILRGKVEFVSLACPQELGLCNVEGALLTGERHIIIEAAVQYFSSKLAGHVVYNRSPDMDDPKDWDATIDCTFCAYDETNIERFEPCITGLLQGPVNRAVTIMDGPFPSLYPWHELLGLNTTTSALYTPFSKTCRTYAEAQEVIASAERDKGRCQARVGEMQKQLGHYWPDSLRAYEFAGYKLSIRAMPRSAADARLVDVIRTPTGLRVRAGKIDAIFHAAKVVEEMLCLH